MINPVTFDDEIFKDINIEGILPIYSISNYGTVINKVTGKQRNIAVTEDGYARVSLSTIDGGHKLFLVHRLVMMVFHPIQNYNELEVNHIYGKKLDNRDTQLEWVTTKENVQHAYRTGLNNNVAENHSKALFTNEQVIQICEGLSKGKSFDMIIQELGPIPHKDIIRAIRSIKDREAWTTISKNYIFPEYENKRDLFTDDQVITICKMLESGIGYRDILISLGYNLNTMSVIELQNMCDIIGDIRNGNRYKDVSKNYDISYKNVMRYDQIFNYDQIHFICKCLENGMSTSDILSNLGINKNEISAKEYEKYRHFISTIKTRKVFKNISNDYAF